MPTHPCAADLDANHLQAALMRAAAGDRSAEAAIRLLAAAGHWLPQFAAAGLILVDGPAASGTEDCAVAWATITWADLNPALQAGSIFGSSGQLRLLRAAASLADGQPVDLRDVAARLDARHLTMVLVAIARAGGAW